MARRKKKNQIPWTGIIMATGAAVGVYFTLDTINRVQALKSLDFRLQDFELTRTGEFIKLDFITEIQNPSAYNYKVKNTDLQFYYTNIRLGRFIKKKLVIPARSRQLVSLPIFIKDGDLNGLVAAIATNRSSIINIQGRLRYKGIGLPIQHDLDLKDYIQDFLPFGG